MNRFRPLVLAFGIALAVLFGQMAAALHDLGHATSQLGDKGGKLPATCDQCFACSQLSGGATSTPLAMPLTVAFGRIEAPADRTNAFTAPIVSFRSRAPPLFS